MEDNLNNIRLSSPEPQRRTQQVTNRRRHQASGRLDGVTAEVQAAVLQIRALHSSALVNSGQTSGHFGPGAFGPGPLAPEKEDRTVIQERVIKMMTATPGVRLEAYQRNMEAGESNGQVIQKEQDAPNAQIKRFEALVQVAAAITGSSADTPAETLAESLREAWDVQRDKMDQMESQIENIKREKEKAQDELKDLVHNMKKITGISGDMESGDMAHDIIESWTEMKEKNLRFERQIKDQMKNIVHLEVEEKAILERIKIFAIDIGVVENLTEIRTDDLVSQIHKKTAELRREIESFRDERALLMEDSIKVQKLTEELAVLRQSQEVKRTRKRSKKWTFFSRNNKVGPEHQQIQSTFVDNKESQFRKYIERMNSKINALEKDKAILESQIGRIMECDEAAKRLAQKLADQNRDLEAENESLEEKVELLEYEVDKRADKINHLQDLVERMGYNETCPNSATNDVQTQADHAVVATLSTTRYRKLDPSTLKAFKETTNTTSSLELDTVGHGAFGLVLIGRLDGMPNPVAVKRPYVPAHFTGQEVDDERKANYGRTRKEALVSELLNGYPYFAQMVGTITLGRELCLVTEFVGDRQMGSSYRLYDALHPTNPTPVLPRWNIAALANDLVRGVSIIHDSGLLHNDIKGDNILLEHRGQRWHGVIIDMGLVTTMAYTVQRSFTDLISESKRSDFPHIAPELIENDEQVSASTDIFAVGILLKKIGQFVEDDGLFAMGEHCCNNQPHRRPKALRDIIPRMAEITSRLQDERRFHRSGTFVIDSEQNESGGSG